MNKFSKQIVSILLTLIITISGTLAAIITPAAATQNSTNSSGAKIMKTGSVAMTSVGNLKGLKVTKSSTNYICLKWDKISGVSGYTVVYRNTAKVKKFVKGKNTPNNYITMKNLGAAYQYEFKVFGYKKADGKIYRGKAAHIMSATKPKKVSGLKLTNSSKNISIKWNKSAVATGYKIYRASAKSNGNYVLYK